jgi:hypothetical protein
LYWQRAREEGVRWWFCFPRERRLGEDDWKWRGGRAPRPLWAGKRRLLATPVLSEFFLQGLWAAARVGRRKKYGF